MYRVSQYPYRNTYRIAIILYRDNPTIIFFFDVRICRHKFTKCPGKENFLKKIAITQVISVLKLNVEKKKHVVSSYVASFCDSNVIDYNWDLLDESFCDVMK